MLVVEPATSRFDSHALTGATEEHVLERISALENRLIRLAEKIEEGVSALVQTASGQDFDSETIGLLQSLLDEANAVSGNRRAPRGNKRTPSEAQIGIGRIRRVLVSVLESLPQPAETQGRRALGAAFTLLETSRAHEGLELLKMAADEGAGGALLASFVGECLFSRGSWDLSADYLRRALSIDPRNGPANLMLGFICAELGEAHQADAYLRRAAVLECQGFSLYFSQGRLFLVQGDHKRAINSLMRAAEFGNLEFCYVAIAEAYLFQSRRKEGEDYLRKALQIKGNNRKAQRLLALIGPERPRSRVSRGKLAAIPDIAAQIGDPGCVEGEWTGNRVHRSSRSSGALVTSGDERLGRILVRDILQCAARG
jgi:tetratricopeptide (TPR) repeat protein